MNVSYGEYRALLNSIHGRYELLMLLVAEIPGSIPGVLQDHCCQMIQSQASSLANLRVWSLEALPTYSSKSSSMFRLVCSRDQRKLGTKFPLKFLNPSSIFQNQAIKQHTCFSDFSFLYHNINFIAKIPSPEQGRCMFSFCQEPILLRIYSGSPLQRFIILSLKVVN